MRIALWAVGTWAAIIPFAVLNGILRESLLVPALGLQVAQPTSGVLLMIVIGALAWVLAGRVGAKAGLTMAFVGLFWVSATFFFETALVLGQGQSWDRVFAQYTFADNNIWPLVMAWTAIAPMTVSRLRFRER